MHEILKYWYVHNIMKVVCYERLCYDRGLLSAGLL